MFGCVSYCHIKEDKLHPRLLKCVFLGFLNGIKGYKLYYPNLKKFIISRDVAFNENQIYKDIIGNRGHVSDDQIEIEASASSQFDTKVPEIKVEAPAIPQTDNIGSTLQRGIEAVYFPLSNIIDLSSY